MLIETLIYDSIFGHRPAKTWEIIVLSAVVGNLLLASLLAGNVERTDKECLYTSKNGTYSVYAPVCPEQDNSNRLIEF